MTRNYYVYIISNWSRTLYIGVTNDLERLVWQHRNKVSTGFASKYNISRLVYFEAHSRIQDAIAREKQLKGWLRSKKVALIQSVNPNWSDLSEDWRHSLNQDSSLRSE